MHDDISMSEFVTGSLAAVFVYFAQRIIAQYDGELDEINKRTEEMMRKIHSVEMQVTRIEATLDRKGNGNVSQDHC